MNQRFRFAYISRRKNSSENVFRVSSRLNCLTSVFVMSGLCAWIVALLILIGSVRSQITEERDVERPENFGFGYFGYIRGLYCRNFCSSTNTTPYIPSLACAIKCPQYPPSFTPPSFGFPPFAPPPFAPPPPFTPLPVPPPPVAPPIPLNNILTPLANIIASLLNQNRSTTVSSNASSLTTPLPTTTLSTTERTAPVG